MRSQRGETGSFKHEAFARGGVETVRLARKVQSSVRVWKISDVVAVAIFAKH
jgi:hypothetical protein